MEITKTKNTHHGHWMIVLSQPEAKIREELLCDFNQSILVELELALDVIEDLACCIPRRAI